MSALLALNMEVMMKKERLDIESKRYTEGGSLCAWYEYNYKFIGSEWLIQALDYVMKDMERVTFISVSANKGSYEEDAFRELSKKYKGKLNFVLSDLGGAEFYKDKEELHMNSNWLLYEKADMPAENLTYQHEIDIILDNKGAVWAKLNRGDIFQRKRRAICLLEKYIEYLRNDESILLIDCYEVKRMQLFKALCNPLKYKLLHGRIMEKRFIDYEEKSTYYYLKKAFKNDKLLTECFDLLEPVPIKIGKQDMRLAKISRKNLVRLVNNII